MSGGRLLWARVNFIRSWQTDSKASARSNEVQYRDLFFVRACRRREFITEQCSLQPFMPERKAFWTEGSTNLLESRKDWKRESRMRSKGWPTAEESAIMRKLEGSDVEPAIL